LRQKIENRDQIETKEMTPGIITAVAKFLFLKRNQKKSKNQKIKKIKKSRN